MESMKDLKNQARSWPEPYGQTARELIRDAHFDLMLCQRRHVPRVVEDLRQALLALEEEMKEKQE